MTDKSIESMRQILSAPITLFRSSNEQERSLFHKRKKGWDYTIGLKSGQSFVAHFDNEDAVFTVRPLNNLVPLLRQIEWKKRIPWEPKSQYDTHFTIEDDPSEDEKKVFREVFSAEKVELKTSWWERKAYVYRPCRMLKHLCRVREILVENEQLQQQLLKGQKILRGLMIPNDSISSIIQNELNERRQKNG